MIKISVSDFRMMLTFLNLIGSYMKKGCIYIPLEGVMEKLQNGLFAEFRKSITIIELLFAVSVIKKLLSHMKNFWQ